MSEICNPQSDIRNPTSAICNPESDIRNPKSEIRTDMAIEAVSGRKDIKGIEKQERYVEDVKITTVFVKDAEASQLLHKPCGTYATIETDGFSVPGEDFSKTVEALAQTLSPMIPKGDVLVVGLGNSDITPDALGPLTAQKTLATRHITGEVAAEAGLSDLRPVAVLAAGVLGQTGMESAEIVRSVCEGINPSCVIAVDALACSGIDRLGNTLQVTDTGISPGSGVANARKQLSKDVLGIPVIAVGVPTVVDMTTIAYNLVGEGRTLPPDVEERGRSMMVTPRDVDQLIDRAAKVVAYGINRALQPSLSITELEGLLG